MNFLYSLFGIAVLGMAFTFLFVLTYSFWKKAQIETMCQIQCSSGDSEVMSFNYNFKEGESEDSKDMKIQEAFLAIQQRRDENHRKYLEIKAESIAQNEKLETDGVDMKMSKIVEANSIRSVQ